MSMTIEQAKAFIKPPVLIPENQQDDLCVLASKEAVNSFLEGKTGQSFRLIGEPWGNEQSRFFYFEHPDHPFNGSKPVNDPANYRSYENAILLRLTPDDKYSIVCGDHLQVLLQTTAQGTLSDCAVLSLGPQNDDTLPILSDATFSGRRSLTPDELIKNFGHQRMHAVKMSHECAAVGQALSSPKAGL